MLSQNADDIMQTATSRIYLLILLFKRGNVRKKTTDSIEGKKVRKKNFGSYEISVEHCFFARSTGTPAGKAFIFASECI